LSPTGAYTICGMSIKIKQIRILIRIPTVHMKKLSVAESEYFDALPVPVPVLGFPFHAVSFL